MNFGRIGLRRYWLDIFFSQGLYFIELYASRNNYHAIVGCIVGLEISFEVALFPVFHIIFITDNRPVIRMLLESLRHHSLTQHVPGRIFKSRASFRQNNSSFTFNHFGIYAKGCDTVSFQVKDHFGSRGREPVGINCYILGGVSIVRTAIKFHRAVELFRPVFFGAIEHHMFEKMGKSCYALVFVSRSYAVKQVHVGVGNGIVLDNEEFHPILQDKCLYIIGLHLCLRCQVKTGENKK